MKVLLLTVTAGQGHNQAAKSLCQYFSENGTENRYLDVFEYINPAVKEILAYGYLMSAKHFSALYGKVYRFAEHSNKEQRMLKITNRIMAHKLVGYIEEFSPDVIICTHVFSSLLIDAIRHKINPRIKSVGIVTDFTFHPFWENTGDDYYITPSEVLNNQAKRRGIPTERLLPIGIPIKPEFAEKTEKKKARELLCIANKKTVLVMSGSMGYGHVEKVIEGLDEADEDFQIISICGRNEKLLKSLDKMQTKKYLENIGFTDKVSLYMDAADCLVTKPGGLTTSEALAKKLPMIMINPIPGQEDRNAEFLLNMGAALKVSKTFTVGDAVYALFSNSERMKNLKEAISVLAKPDSTKDLVSFVSNLK